MPPNADPSSAPLAYALLVAAGVLGAASDAVLNQWARTGRAAWLAGAYAAWLLVATVLGLLLRSGHFGFGAAVVLFLLVNAAAALALDGILFSGRMSVRGWVGIALGAAAIACIETARAPHPPAE